MAFQQLWNKILKFFFETNGKVGFFLVIQGRHLNYLSPPQKKAACTSKEIPSAPSTAGCLHPSQQSPARHADKPHTKRIHIPRPLQNPPKIP